MLYDVITFDMAFNPGQIQLIVKTYNHKPRTGDRKSKQNEIMISWTIYTETTRGVAILSYFIWQLAKFNWAVNWLQWLPEYILGSVDTNH